MISQVSTSKLILCFFTGCKYRGEEGECGFSGTLIISIEGDCQCMERKAREDLCAGSVTELLGAKF